MKITNTTNEIDRHGIGVETVARIKATEKAFRILSSGLYSDKIRAIIRELSCNALDAQIEANNENTPFLITLPSRMEPEFVIRDFGTGLSDADVIHIFTTYFESTKTESENLVGFLGLGSKSPFSYTDSFMIISFFNGNKSVYNWHLNEKGEPAVALMNKSETKEPNGLEIRFGVQENDFNKFKQKAAVVLREFDVIPIISPEDSCNIQKVEFAIQGSCWGIRNRNTDENRSWDVKVGNGAHAIMGHIRYPLTDCNSDDMTTAQQLLLKQNIDINFKLGTIEPSASRESISYTTTTINNIKARLDEVLEEISNMVAKEFNSCKNLWEARCKASNIINNKWEVIAKFLQEQEVIKWNGEFINCMPIHHKIKDLDIMAFRRKENRRRRRSSSENGNFKIKYEYSASLIPSTNTRIFEKDIDRGSFIRAKQALIDMAEEKHINTLADTSNIDNIVLTATDFETNHVYLVGFADDAQKQEFLDNVGLKAEHLEPISSVQRSRKTKTSAYVSGVSEKAKVKVLSYDYDHAVNCNECSKPEEFWKTTEINMDDGGFYIPISRYKLEHGVEPVHPYTIARQVEAIRNANKILNSLVQVADLTECIGVKPTAIAKFDAHPKWIRFDKEIKNRIQPILDLITKEDVYYSVSDNNTLSYDSEQFVEFMVRNSAPNNNVVYVIKNLISDYKSNKTRANTICNLLKNMGMDSSLSHYCKNKVKTTRCSIQDTYNKLIGNKYPMVKYCSFDSWGKNLKQFNAVSDYMNTVDQKNINDSTENEENEENEENVLQSA